MIDLGIIYDKVESYSKMDKFQLFADCVREKLEIHLIDYYNRLEDKLERAYDRVMNADSKMLKDANKQLKKVERAKY